MGKRPKRTEAQKRSVILTAVDVDALTMLEKAERGGSTELRFFSAMQAPRRDTPHWFLGIRRATKTEDLQGIDAIATLDIGEVPMQIKTSMAGLREYLKRYPHEQRVIVVIPDYVGFNQLRRRAFEFLYRYRQRKQSKRFRTKGSRY